jgi:integrase
MIKKRKNKNGIWRYQVRVKDCFGRYFPAQTFDRKVDAENRERELKFSLVSRNGAMPVQRTILFAEFWLLWMQECRSTVSEGWKVDQQRLGDEYILPYIGQRQLREIEPRQIASLLELMRREGKASQTILHLYNTLHKAFEDAVHHFEFLEHNPVKKRYRPKLARRHRKFLSPEQSRLLLARSQATNLGPAIWLSLLAGLRSSEVMALTFASLNFELGQIQIRAAYKRKVKRIEPYPKQNDWGVAVMPSVLASYLKELRVGKSANDFVAGGADGQMLSYHVFYKGLRKICGDLGLPLVATHELRHSCTELWIEHGASMEDLRRQLNHASINSTKLYVHRSDSRLHNIGSRIQVCETEQPRTPNQPPRLRIVR